MKVGSSTLASSVDAFERTAGGATAKTRESLVKVEERMFHSKVCFP
jgi:hypothetical protein